MPAGCTPQHEPQACWRTGSQNHIRHARIGGRVAAVCARWATGPISTNLPLRPRDAVMFAPHAACAARDIALHQARVERLLESACYLRRARDPVMPAEQPQRDAHGDVFEVVGARASESLSRLSGWGGSAHERRGLQSRFFLDRYRPARVLPPDSSAHFVQRACDHHPSPMLALAPGTEVNNVIGGADGARPTSPLTEPVRVAQIAQAQQGPESVSDVSPRWWSPILGSSSTYSTPISPLPIWVASLDAGFASLRACSPRGLKSR